MNLVPSAMSKATLRFRPSAGASALEDAQRPVGIRMSVNTLMPASSAIVRQKIFFQQACRVQASVRVVLLTSSVRAMSGVEIYSDLILITRFFRMRVASVPCIGRTECQELKVLMNTTPVLGANPSVSITSMSSNAACWFN